MQAVQDTLTNWIPESVSNTTRNVVTIASNHPAYIAIITIGITLALFATKSCRCCCHRKVPKKLPAPSTPARAATPPPQQRKPPSPTPLKD